jgi:ketosteroid isomerase-like protein
MQKTTLAISTFLLLIFVTVNGYAQSTEKKDGEKTQTGTADAWRQAIPEAEQTANTPLLIAPEESRDNVEAVESAALIEKRILELEQRLVEAIKKRDSASLKHLLADDFIPAGAHITGALQDKTNYIEWTLKNLELKSYNLEKTTVRVYETTAVVTSQFKQQAVVAGSILDGNFIATDVWVKHGKRWQIVSQHISPVSKP